MHVRRYRGLNGLSHFVQQRIEDPDHKPKPVKKMDLIDLDSDSENNFNDSVIPPGGKRKYSSANSVFGVA